MTLSVAEFNAMSRREAADVMRSVCGATRWVDDMVDRRPYGTFDRLLSEADEIWDSTEPADWHEAFSQHPRIGESKSAVTQDSRGKTWSAREQAGVNVAMPTVQDEIAVVNRAYEARFGHIYIVCAAEKSADELLSIARDRLHNDPATELRVAAEEQRKIMRLRLGKLFGESE